MQYIVLDMEWNQPWDMKQAKKKPIYLKGEIIQIGAVKLDENFKIVDTFKVLISPRYYKKMHSKVSKLTKITTGDLKSGLIFEEALAKFKNWCGDDFVFLIWGWDDIPMLKDNMVIFGEDENWLPKWYNVQTIYDQQIAKEGRQHALSDAMERVGETLIDAHDALNDAYGTARVCLHLDMKKGFEDYVAVEIKRKIAKLKMVKEFPSRQLLEKDEELHSFTCPMCNKTILCNDMFTYKWGRKISIEECSCGQKFFVRMKSRKKDEVTIRVDRTVTELNDENEDFYYEQLEKSKEKIAHV